MPVEACIHTDREMADLARDYRLVDGTNLPLYSIPDNLIEGLLVVLRPGPKGLPD